MSRPSGGGGWWRWWWLAAPRGGGSRPSGGDISRPSGGGGSRPSGGGGGDISRPSGGQVSRPSQQPSGGGRVPSAPAQRPSGGASPSVRWQQRIATSVGQSTQYGRPSLATAGAARRRRSSGHCGSSRSWHRQPAFAASRQPRCWTGRGEPSRHATRPATRRTARVLRTGDVGNFLGIAGGAAAGAALGGGLANRPSTLPADRAGIATRPGAGEHPVRPEWRPDLERAFAGPQRTMAATGGHLARRLKPVRLKTAAQARNDLKAEPGPALEQPRYRSGEDSRTGAIKTAKTGRAIARNWWTIAGTVPRGLGPRQRSLRRRFGRPLVGLVRLGRGYGNYPSNPWWWWRPAVRGAAAAFVSVATLDPVYIDYGMNVIYEGDTVYVGQSAYPGRAMQPADDRSRGECGTPHASAPSRRRATGGGSRRGMDAARRLRPRTGTEGRSDHVLPALDQSRGRDERRLHAYCRSPMTSVLRCRSGWTK